jgi:FtsZ-interacting cell division protein ZipA
MVLIIAIIAVVVFVAILFHNIDEEHREQTLKKDHREELKKKVEEAEDKFWEDVADAAKIELPEESVLKRMTKKQLDEYAIAVWDVKLDRRKTKPHMIAELQEAVNSKS